MSKIILVTGGARSGKSSYAEGICKELGAEVLYIATAIPFDEEMEIRIKKHKDRRPEFFKTIECYKGFENIKDEFFQNKKVVMLDCVTIMVTNILLEYMKDKGDHLSNITEDVSKIILQEIFQMLNVFKIRVENSIIVTNELGMGIVPENYLSRIFRDIAGLANQELAKHADEVYFCVSGIPIKIK